MTFVRVALAFLVGQLLSGCAGAGASRVKYYPEPPAKTKLVFFLNESVASGSLTKKKERRVEFVAKSYEPPLRAAWQTILASASLNFRIASERKNGCQIVIFEEGNEVSEDEYNRYLVKTGPRELVRLRLNYELSQGKLELSEVSRGK